MKEQILKLRKEGKSYREIQKVLNCSKGTIAYHCGNGQKEKNIKRAQKRRYLKSLDARTNNFQERKTSQSIEIKSSPRKLLQHKADDFQRERFKVEGKTRLGKHCNKTFTYKDVLEKFGELTICYLTGREIDLKEPKTYNFDHITPVAKGGKNMLNNLGITCKEANQAKSDLTVDELLKLCKEILEHNGYEVINGSEAKLE